MQKLQQSISQPHHISLKCCNSTRTPTCLTVMRFCFGMQRILILSQPQSTNQIPLPVYISRSTNQSNLTESRQKTPCWPDWYAANVSEQDVRLWKMGQYPHSLGIPLVTQQPHQAPAQGQPLSIKQSTARMMSSHYESRDGNCGSEAKLDPNDLNN